MNSHWLQTFGLAAIASVAIAVTALAADPVFLGYGSDPQWSPSGELIGAWRGDTLAVFDVTARKEIKTISVERPKFYYWLNEDSIALSYQGRTEAARPVDRFPIISRNVLSLNSGMHEISQDTIYDSQNKLTHWRRLPDGRVGVFRHVNGERELFYTLQDGEFRESPFDPEKQNDCPGWQDTELTSPFISPNCSLAVAYIGDQSVELITNAGASVGHISRRATPLSNGKIEITGKPKWSPDSRFICFRRVTEDGHYQYGSELFVFDVSTGEQQRLITTSSDKPFSYEWSPITSSILVSEPDDGRLLQWQF